MLSVTRSGMCHITLDLQPLNGRARMVHNSLQLRDWSRWSGSHVNETKLHGCWEDGRAISEELVRYCMQDIVIGMIVLVVAQAPGADQLENDRMTRCRFVFVYFFRFHFP